MNQTKIYQLIYTKNIFLVVFRTEAHCWQFRILSAAGEIFGEQKVYYTSKAAEIAGRDWIVQG